MSTNPVVSSSNNTDWTMVRGPQQRLPTVEFPSHAASAFSKSKPAKTIQAHFSETATRAFSRPSTSDVSRHNNVGFSESASAAFGAVKQTHRDDMPNAFGSGSGGSSNDNNRTNNFDSQASSAFGKKRLNKQSSQPEVSSTYSARSNNLSHMLSAALPDTPSGVVSVDYNKSALRRPEQTPTKEEMFPALGSATTSMVTPKKSFADVIRQRAADDEAAAAKSAEEAARARMKAQREASERAMTRIVAFPTKKAVAEPLQETHDEYETAPDIHDLDYVPPYQRKPKSYIDNIDEDFIAEDDHEQEQTYED